MPIYEYECRTCGEEFEIIQKFSDPPLKKHTCSPKSVIRRKISLNAFQLKGGGWYNEGYSSGNGASSDKDPKSESSSKDKSGSEGSGSDNGAKSESSSSGKSSSEGSGSGSGSEKKTSGSDGKNSTSSSSSSKGSGKSSGASQASS